MNQTLKISASIVVAALSTLLACAKNAPSSIVIDWKRKRRRRGFSDNEFNQRRYL